uniref:Venom polypeptide n=1 Tax=Dolopus genitalis TaxID=2488630 RepID=A0A3G5BIN0_DOLGE|nr:venom polypeptide [Dolopus genitalis]
MRLISSLLLVAVAVLSPVTMADFAAKSGEFAADLYTKVIDGKDGENVIISPFSVQTCVGLAYAGAGGVTAEEMAKGLRLTSNDRDEVAKSFGQVLDSYSTNPLLKIANKVYIKTGYTLKPQFNEIATKNFHSEAENINFAQKQESADKINSWVEGKTNNKIKDLISADSLSDDTRCVLVNAIYFKGFWDRQFEKEQTQKEDFWISETENVKVDMMNMNHKFKYGEFADLDASAVELPYKDSDLSMLIILPNTKTGLKALESKFSTINIAEMSKNMYKSEVNLKLPRFKIEFSMKLNEPLKKMGMTSMFSGADFSNLLEQPEPLKVSEVVHKAFIEVNEEGAEAAAATGLGVMLRSRPLPRQLAYFYADHPFIFFLKSPTEILFAGRYLKPQ